MSDPNYVDIDSWTREDIAAMPPYERPLRTWLLRDVGYDVNERGQLWEITDADFWSAVRQVPGFEKASFTEPIAPGASTVAVYRYLPGTNGTATKIGCVRDETPLV